MVNGSEEVTEDKENIELGGGKYNGWKFWRVGFGMEFVFFLLINFRNFRKIFFIVLREYMIFCVCNKVEGIISMKSIFLRKLECWSNGYDSRELKMK